MIRILLGSVSLDAEHGGGTAQRTRFLARYLARAGADCQVVTMEDGDLAQDLRADGIPVYATGFLKLPYHVPLLNPRRIDGLVGQADVLHLLGYWNLLSIALASSARRQRRPYLLSAAGEFAALDLRHPVKLAFHRLFGRQMIAGARGLIAITEREQAEIVGRFGLSPGRVLVLPNGVEPVSDERATDDRLPKQPFVLFMGRLAPIKGPDLLLGAFARVANRFADVILVFAGPDGGLLHALERRRAELGLEDRVVFTGFVDERAKRRLPRCLPSGGSIKGRSDVACGDRGRCARYPRYRDRQMRLRRGAGDRRRSCRPRLHRGTGRCPRRPPHRSRETSRLGFRAAYLCP